jgi:hypothetical protein
MAHVDPVASIVGGLAVMLLTAKLGGELAIRVKQPAERADRGHHPREPVIWRRGTV